MAKTSDRVMDMVRREVAKNPDVKSGELYEKAKKLDRSMSSLSLRQFHARYPLQVKRALALGGGKRRKKPANGRRKKPANGRRKGAAGRKTAGASTTAAKKRKVTRKRTAAKKRPGRPAKKRGRRAGSDAGAPQRRRRGPGRPPAVLVTGERGTVRAVLLEFAGEVVNADSKADMISVISRMDHWVDRVVRAAG
ncbi:MAG TPA: hypothetical protein VMM79_14465 [Longimicrobiales bacterium]|nr:hypothetical protein [Longimicrobiales bacterium]